MGVHHPKTGSIPMAKAPRQQLLVFRVPRPGYTWRGVGLMKVGRLLMVISMGGYHSNNTLTISLLNWTSNLFLKSRNNFVSKE